MVKIFKIYCYKVLNIYLYNMSDILKKIIIGFVCVFILAIISFFVANYKIKGMLIERIDNMPNHIKINFKAIDVNSFSGNLSVQKPAVTIYGQTTDSVNALFQLERLEIRDISYWNVLFKDEISIETMLLNDLKATYFYNSALKSEVYSGNFKNSIKKDFNIAVFEINSGQIEIINQKTDSLFFKTDDFNLKMNNLNIDESSIKNKIPFEFDDIALDLKNIYYHLNSYEDLKIETATLKNNNSIFNNIKIKTKYSKTKLSKIISKERDHFNLQIKTLNFEDTDFSFSKDSVFQLNIAQIDIKEPKIDMYRDKLVTDDESVKPLYSKMLRDLNFNITLNEINIDNGEIIYEEQVNMENTAGQLKFSKFNTIVKNLGNAYSEQKSTEIKIESVFMENTPVNIDWNFNVSNLKDHFTFKADIGRLNTTDLNQFTQPNLNVKLDGELLKTYFTINGNNTLSNIDLKTNYNEFNVQVLKENGNEKNKFLSSLVNLFISKNSQKKSSYFRYGSSEDVERDKTKSIFNFIWLNTKSGLLSAMTGSGEKKG